MHWTKAHGEEAQDKVFSHVTNASATVAIAAGDVCIWDGTNNTAVAGILRETRGMRVLQAPTNWGITDDDFLRTAGVAEQAIPITLANQTRNDCFLLQRSGFHGAVKATGTTHTAFDAACASDVAASVISVAVATLTAEQVARKIGHYPTTVGSTPATVPVILSGLL